MWKLVAVVLLIVGLILGGLTYTYYSASTIAGSLARFYRDNPEEKPSTLTGESREQYIEGELRRSETNRNMAMLLGAGSLMLVAGGAALLISSIRRGKPSEAQLLQDQTSLGLPSTWANAVLTPPVTVQYRLFQKILIAFIVVFFVGLSILMIVTNGFKSHVVLLVALIGLLLLVLLLFNRRAGRKVAYVFDPEGVTRGDNQKFSWNDIKSVDYLMALKRGGSREYLWRIELIFTNGEVWLIPLRVKNLEEIKNLVSAIPTVHRKRRA